MIPSDLTIEVDCEKWKSQGVTEDIDQVPDEFDF